MVDRAAKLKIKVTLANGKDTEAILLRDDDLLDLALIKIESKEPLPYLSLETLSPNLLGQTVLVVWHLCLWCKFRSKNFRSSVYYRH